MSIDTSGSAVSWAAVLRVHTVELNVKQRNDTPMKCHCSAVNRLYV